MKPRTLVLNHAVGSVGEPAEAHGCPFHVTEKTLELLSILRLYPSIPVQIETRVRPALHVLDDLPGDLPLALHDLEEALTEELLEPREVDILHAAEDTVGGEKTERDESMTVGVRYEQISEESSLVGKSESRSARK